MKRVLALAALCTFALLAPQAASARARHHAESDTPPPPPLPPMVTLNPAPGITFQIPQLWVACEDEYQKLLSSARDSLGMKDKFCAMSPQVPTKLRAFDPRPLHNVGLIFNFHQKQTVTPQALADMAPGDLQQIQPVICDNVTRPIRSLGHTIASCDVTLGSFAGHRAMIMSIVEIDPAHPDFKVLLTSYELPYSEGYMQIQFSYAQFLQKIVQPELDAVIGSLQIASVPSTGDSPPAATPPGTAPATPPATTPAPAPDNSDTEQQSAPASPHPKAPDSSI